MSQPHPKPASLANLVPGQSLVKRSQDQAELDRVREEVFHSLSDLSKCIPLGLRRYVLSILEGMIRAKGRERLAWVQEYRIGIIEPLLNKQQQDELMQAISRLRLDQIKAALNARDSSEARQIIEASCEVIEDTGGVSSAAPEEKSGGVASTAAAGEEKTGQHLSVEIIAYQSERERARIAEIDARIERGRARRRAEYERSKGVGGV